MSAGSGAVCPNRRSWLVRLALCLVPLTVAAVFGAAETPAAAQTFDLLSPKKSRVPKPEFQAVLEPQAVRPGDVVTVSVSVTLPVGYYIYGTEKSFGGRTRIEVQTTGLEIIDAEFSPDHPGKTAFDPDLDAEVTKYYDRVTWAKKYRVAADAVAVGVTGTLQGQYCSAPEAGGQCVPINPPYRFDLAARLSATDPSQPIGAPPAFAATIRPTRTRQGQEVRDPIEYQFQLSPPNARRGDTVRLSITATPDAGWHTYSLTQTGPGAAPTEIELNTLRNLMPRGDAFLADHPFSPENSGDNILEVYHQQVTWTREFEVTADEPGDYGVSGTLSYAVCDARSCLPVKAIEFALGQIDGSESGSPASPFAAADEIADQPAPPLKAAPKLPAVKAAGGAPPQDQGLIPFLLLCLAGGFFALLTPCSFPMVPITVSFFLKQSELQHKRPWLLALVYCGSIVAAFTVLGVGIAAVFGVNQLNALANIAWLNLLIGGVFVVFALNMLGMFEIHVPSSLLTWSSSHEGKGSYLGAMFMGLTFTLTSFTCTFAIAGGLLAGAAQGQFYWPIIGMLAFGTAFAAPFFVLALVPGLLAKLPKSGGWMNSVKVVLGLLELGAAVKFFSIADPRQVVFDHVVVMLLWFVLSLATALYLFGVFRLPHDSATGSISVVRALLAMAFLGLSGLLGIGVALPDAGGGMLMNQILAFAPPRFAAGEGRLGPMVDHHGLQFALDVTRAIPVATEERRAILLDFTGVNCANCRYMERLMAQPAWKQRIDKFVPIQLYVDVPAIPGISDPKYAEELWQRNLELFGSVFPGGGMPSYAVATPDGSEILAVYEGAERADRAGSFAQFLDDGYAAWEKIKGTWQPAPSMADMAQPAR